MIALTLGDAAGIGPEIILKSDLRSFSRHLSLSALMIFSFTAIRAFWKRRTGRLALTISSMR